MPFAVSVTDGGGVLFNVRAKDFPTARDFMVFPAIFGRAAVSLRASYSRYRARKPEAGRRRVGGRGYVRKASLVTKIARSITKA